MPSERNETVQAVKKQRVIIVVVVVVVVVVNEEKYMLGHNSLEQMIKLKTTRAGIDPYLTSHCFHATTNIIN